MKRGEGISCGIRDRRFAMGEEGAADRRIMYAVVGRDTIVRQDHEHGFDEEVVDEFPPPPPPPDARGDGRPAAAAQLHEPRLVQLNLRASLMGVHIVDDQELTFFSRQSSMSSMLSEKFPRVRPASGTAAAHGAVVDHVAAMAHFKCEAGVAGAARSHADQRPPGCSMAHGKSPRPIAARSRAHSGVPVLYSRGLLEARARNAASAGVINGSMLLQSAASPGDGSASRILSYWNHGILSPQTPPGTTAHSGLLNADQVFEIMGEAALTTNSASTASSAGDAPALNDKTFKQLLLGRSRLSQMSGQKRRECVSRESLDEQEEEEIAYISTSRPLSTHESLQDSFPVSSPSSSERSFGVGFTTRAGQSLIAGDGGAPHGLGLQGSLGREAERPKSQLAQYLIAINAVTDYGSTDDDDIVLAAEGPSRGPSEVAWHQPEEQDHEYHNHPRQDPVVQACIQAAHDEEEDQPKPCPGAHEQWTSNSSSWNLSLVQKPSKSRKPAGCIAAVLQPRNNKQQNHVNSATTHGRSARRRHNLRLLAKDFLLSVSGRSDRSSDQLPGSRWSRLRSWRRRSESTSSGRLQIESSFQCDSDETDTDQPTSCYVERQEDQAQVDEDDFPFDSPIASSFIFDAAADKHRISTDTALDCWIAARRVAGGGLPAYMMCAAAAAAAGCRPLVKEYEQDSDAARTSTDSWCCDNVDDTCSSLELSPLRGGEDALGFLDQPPQWVPSRSCYHVKEQLLDRSSIGICSTSSSTEVLDRSSLGISSTSRATLSGYILEYGSSGRFRVDLQPAGPRLEYNNSSAIRRPSSTSPAFAGDATTTTTTTTWSLRMINSVRRRRSFYKRLMLSPCMVQLDNA